MRFFPERDGGCPGNQVKSFRRRYPWCLTKSSIPGIWRLNGDLVFLGKFDHSLNPWRGFALLHNQSVATTFRG